MLLLKITYVPSANAYRWHLYDGPDGAYEASGHSPTPELAVAEARAASESLWYTLVDDHNLTPQPHARPLPHPPSDSHPTHIHTPEGETLPAQQNIPGHRTPLGENLHRLPSRSG